MTAPDEKGLLSNLPNRRPAVETPRRTAARKAAGERRGEARPIAPPPEPSEGSGLEQLARAGIGLAGGAAAVGVKLAGRALGELGRAVGRGP